MKLDLIVGVTLEVIGQINYGFGYIIERLVRIRN
jgi:hypothetical protein